MNDPITIKVTQRHIDHGKRGDCSYCPIALAIADAISFSVLDMPFWKTIQVMDNTEVNIRGRRYVSSFDMTKWMTAFDDMLEVSPVEFVLIPHEKEDEYEF
jgi:hypothetical protein